MVTRVATGARARATGALTTLPPRVQPDAAPRCNLRVAHEKLHSGLDLAHVLLT